MTIRTALRLTTLLAAAITAPAAAQQPQPAAKGAAFTECVSTFDERVYKAYKDAAAAGKPMGEAEIGAARQGIARECVAGVKRADLEAQQLPALALLYRFAGDSARADSTATYMIARAPAGLERARVLYTLSTAFMGTPRGDAYAASLDGMPAEAAPLKFQAHAQALQYYRHEDVDARVMEHAKAVIALAPQLGATARDPRAVASFVAAYKGLAEVYGDYGQVDSALAVLDRGIAAFGALAKDSASTLRTLRARYAMVGTPAPAIEAKTWLNAPAGTRTMSFGNGKVAVMQFTATWCPPCRKSYPTMIALAKRFARPDFLIFMETNLYGVFEGTKVTAAEELASDREYYLTKHGMTFPIGIYNTELPAPDAPYENANADRYHLTDIPQIVVADKKGTIRRIFVGWDEGHERRLMELVAKLLAE